MTVRSASTTRDRCRLKRGLDTPYVGRVTIQPVFSRPLAGIDPLDRLTHTGVLAR
jgi:hypothetical protein